jgi:hypothetical protein
MKTRSVGAEMFHAGGRTDVTKPIVAFRNFANAPQNDAENYSVRSLKASTTHIKVNT